jgi:phosphate transport system substrate-binding protein
VNRKQIQGNQAPRRAKNKVLASGIVALGLTATLTACGAGNETSGSGGGLSGTINGAGSSAQSAAMDAWRKDFQSTNSSATINYDPSGSGAGVESFLQKAVDFAGSDSALDAEAGEIDKAKERCGADPIEIPNYVSPIAVVFNVAGVEELNLTPETLAKVFEGRITKWNDPAISADNAGAKLPDAVIRPVHRSDESGTTKNFTDYLEKAAGGAWTNEADKVWPSDLSGEAAAQTSGMVATVKQTEGSIGYADLSATKGLNLVSIKVGDEFVVPNEEGAAKALEVSATDDSRGDTDLVVKLDRATTEPGAYPLALVSYLIGCPAADDDQGKLVAEFFTYVVSSEGQESAAKNAGSAPLPANLQEQAAAIVKGMGS